MRNQKKYKGVYLGLGAALFLLFTCQKRDYNSKTSSIFIESSLQLADDKMKTDKELPELGRNYFLKYYRSYLNQENSVLRESDIEPVAKKDLITQSNSIDLKSIGEKNLKKLVFLKLNGGLGTSMGLKEVKSKLRIKGDLTFLDIIARQSIEKNTPLLLMNTKQTSAQSKSVLDKYPRLKETGIPNEFFQFNAPKISEDTKQPISYPKDPTLEWYPPGHGALYVALQSDPSILDILLEKGYEHLFISNSDNLGAVVDTSILGTFVASKAPFMMEVTLRTEQDSKGGHLAKLKVDGSLILREGAQTAKEDMADFQDISKHSFFNTNNIWINLEALNIALIGTKNSPLNGILPLPLIVNSNKTIDSEDPNSPKVVQLETAMGAALSILKGAKALEVPRERFAPVKTTNQLLLLRSDAYKFLNNTLVPLKEGVTSIAINLDNQFYKLVDDFESRMKGEFSLIDATSVTIKGDIKFSNGATFIGDVALENETPSQAVLLQNQRFEAGKYIFSNSEKKFLRNR